MFVNLPKFLNISTIKRKIVSYVIFMKMKIWIYLLLSQAKNSGRQCHFKIWLDCHKLKKNSLPDYAHVNKVSKKIEKKMTINVIQHDDKL
jgi:hypothetical protein